VIDAWARRSPERQQAKDRLDNLLVQFEGSIRVQYRDLLMAVDAAIEDGRTSESAALFALDVELASLVATYGVGTLAMEYNPYDRREPPEPSR